MTPDGHYCSVAYFSWLLISTAVVVTRLFWRAKPVFSPGRARETIEAMTTRGADLSPRPNQCLATLIGRLWSGRLGALGLLCGCGLALLLPLSILR
jgi:hypothetical protein